MTQVKMLTDTQKGDTAEWLIRMIETCEDAGMRKAFATRLTALSIQQHGWQPISSAPKHVTVVVYCLTEASNWSCKAYQDEDGVWWRDDFEGMMGSSTLGTRPTHWMPRPKDVRPDFDNLPPKPIHTEEK